jgi:ribosome maturation factor RimP
LHKEEIRSKIEEMLSDYLAEKDLEIYQIQYKKEGPDWKLKLVLDKTENAEDEYVNIEECEDVSRFLSDKLDEEDFIDRAYLLEVSSPGLDRELIKDSDFRRFAGRPVEIKLYEAIDGNKKLEGNLIGKDGDIVKVEADGQTIELQAKKISKINLAVIF